MTSGGSVTTGRDFGVADLVGRGRALKVYRSGTDRTLAPDQTLVRARVVAARAGITRIANVTGLDRIGIPVVTVCRPNSRSVSVAQGKGLTLEAAKASGLMEAIEGYHAETIEAPLQLTTQYDLERQAEVVTKRLPRLRGTTFDPRRKLMWIEGDDLGRGHRVWVPFDLVHTDYTPATLNAGAGPCFFVSSNGLASGNHYLEAVSHGICELIERDAVTLWSLGGRSAPRLGLVDLDSVTDAPCRELLELYRRAEIAVVVHEVTSDVGVPVFRCTIADRRGAGRGAMFPIPGSGCHPRKEIALMRALTEAAQGRLTIISGARDDLSRRLYSDDAAETATAEFLEAFVGRSPDVDFGTVPSYDGPTLEDDVQWELEQLSQCGFETIVVVDLSKPSFNIPVVRVVIPGLEPMCDAPGFVPGTRALEALQAGARA